MFDVIKATIFCGNPVLKPSPQASNSFALARRTLLWSPFGQQAKAAFKLTLQ